jgi:hypothetical protein
LRSLATAALLAAPAAFCALAAFGAAPALAIEPNGSFIQVTGQPQIYRVLGSSPLWVRDCGPLDGCPGVVQVPNLDGYATVPANGSFLRIENGPEAGWIGTFIGGAPVHVRDCAPLGGCAGVIGMDDGGAYTYAVQHLAPVNGSFFRVADGALAGTIAEFIGGSPIRVASCAPLGGCPGVTAIDAGGANEWWAAHPVPANGSFLRIADGGEAGWIGIFVGGALFYVGDCAPLDGCSGVTDIDSGGEYGYALAHPLPANGSFVSVADGPEAGSVFRVAGGALLPISDCAALGGCAGYTTIENIGFDRYIFAHPKAADGTILLGLPSHQSWEILAGQRVKVSPTPGEVTVNDASLSAIPIAKQAASGTSTLHGRHRRKLRVKLAIRWRWNLGRTQLERVHLGRLSHRASVRVSCRGAGCPSRGLAAHGAGVQRALAGLVGHVYRVGDRIRITFNQPGRLPERVLAVIRYNRKPAMTLL